MNVTTYDGAEAFLGRTQAVLTAREDRFGLMLGIALRLVEAPLSYGSPPFYATVGDGPEPVLMALMTPPYKLQLASPGPVPDEAFGPLAAVLAREGWDVPAVLAEENTSLAFARVWADLTHRDFRTGMRQRIYALHRVIPPRDPGGALRPARMEDLDLAASWTGAFHQDVFEGEVPGGDRAEVRASIEAGQLFFWADPDPVSMCGLTRPTPRGMAVSMVYTPPARRRRGYAAAMVAALSQQVLDGGRDFCTLFTDLANPTSNSIYRRIGYEPLCDVVDVVFSDGEAS